jgi:E3 ubiquitin-protein ligase RNF115/126
MGCASSRHTPSVASDRTAGEANSRRQRPEYHSHILEATARNQDAISRRRAMEFMSNSNQLGEMRRTSNRSGSDVVDLSVLNRLRYGNQSNGSEEIRRLQSDLDTLEVLFQRLLGQSFTAQLVRNIEAINLIDHSNDTSVIPPAASSAIENLTCIEVSKEDLEDECNTECCICFFQHNVGDKGIARLPCGHLFHRKCVVEWLEKKCSCPICRYEIPSNNQTFELGRIERMKERTLRVRPHELERMSISELQSMADTSGMHDRSELIELLRNSDRVDILEAAPQGEPLPSAVVEEEKLEVESNIALAAGTMPSNSSPTTFALNT